MLKKLYKVNLAVFVIIAVILIGICGYMLIEKYPFLDALYMTIITLSTVGFSEVHKLSDAGKIFTTILIITNLGSFAYAISTITKSIVDGEFRNFFKIYRTNVEIKKMENHVIICGYGRNGKQAAIELIGNKYPFVVIEQTQDIIIKNQHPEITFLQGDATIDEILLNAGILKAKAIITTMPIDADNLYVVLTARSLKPDLIIISRASEDSSAKKLKMAGANNVIMPEKVGGTHMVSLVLKPDIVDFLNHITVSGTSTTNLEEIICNNLPDEYHNATIEELGIRAKSGANIIGFKTPQGEYIINPSQKTKMIHNAKLFVLGTPAQIKIMRHFLGNKI